MALVSLVASAGAGRGPALAGAAAPAPAMVGGPGLDADGYPLETTDKRAVLRLLRARQFDTLETWLSDLQSQFESDWRKEYWPMDALDAFGNPDPTLKPLMDEWVEAKPDSYMALAARGIHHEAIGWHRRGGNWASETPPENFRGMEEAHRASFPDLDLALMRRPSLVAVHRTLIRIAKANSAPSRVKRGVLDQALAVCPECFQVRVSFILGLLPRWGGSYERMRAFAEESARASSNPRMRLLAGYADADQCNRLDRDDREDEALMACNRALAVGESADFLEDRAQLLQVSDPPAALADCNRALQLRPQRSDILALRAWLLARKRDFVGHARDIAVLQEIDPVRKVKKGDLAWAAQGVAYEAGRFRKAGRQADEVAALERAIALDPDNLHNHLRLDAALVRSNKLKRVPPMWRRYLSRHPTDARAHLELAGALHHLGKEDQAMAAAAKACRLGEQMGCTIVQRRGAAR
jgi:tetratricopeptide (TPR) repeat protein